MLVDFGDNDAENSQDESCDQLHESINPLRDIYNSVIEEKTIVILIFFGIICISG